MGHYECLRHDLLVRLPRYSLVTFRPVSTHIATICCVILRAYSNDKQPTCAITQKWSHMMDNIETVEIIAMNHIEMVETITMDHLEMGDNSVTDY
ncbi:hypothetical protein TNCV_2551461 [Trichonephila clavipes]|nr:hypothetical protein TNCV_2551461 [Trichonephila clavipes]